MPFPSTDGPIKSSYSVLRFGVSWGCKNKDRKDVREEEQMNRFSAMSKVAACMAAFIVVAGCGDSADQQQAASSGATPAAEKVTLKVASAFPTSLALVGEGAHWSVKAPLFSPTMWRACPAARSR
jgi:hypothetical protein